MRGGDGHGGRVEVLFLLGIKAMVPDALNRFHLPLYSSYPMTHWIWLESAQEGFD